MINIRHTPFKNVVQLFAELLEVMLVGAALKAVKTKAVAVLIPHGSGMFPSKDDIGAASPLQAAPRWVTCVCVHLRE